MHQRAKQEQRVMLLREYSYPELTSGLVLMVISPLAYIEGYVQHVKHTKVMCKYLPIHVFMFYPQTYHNQHLRRSV